MTAVLDVNNELNMVNYQIYVTRRSINLDRHTWYKVMRLADNKMLIDTVRHSPLTSCCSSGAVGIWAWWLRKIELIVQHVSTVCQRNIRYHQLEWNHWNWAQNHVAML